VIRAGYCETERMVAIFIHSLSLRISLRVLVWFLQNSSVEKSLAEEQELWIGCRLCLGSLD